MNTPKPVPPFKASQQDCNDFTPLDEIPPTSPGELADIHARSMVFWSPEQRAIRMREYLKRAAEEEEQLRCDLELEPAPPVAVIFQHTLP